MSKKVVFTVDGKKIEAPEGSALLQVLLDNSISVPHFCYHEALGMDGNCRMCMVEIEGQKRPQIACDTPIKENMVVNTNNHSINAVKRSILELELLSHPIDCPTCDQAGECKLQDYYMEFGLTKSRRRKEYKQHKLKHLDIGKNIILDQERCVLCARCTRFTQEITQTNELAIIGRGNSARVSTLPGQKMQTPYAMNIIDLCPVGALTSKDFRFKQRVWFMHSASSICHGCDTGCNIIIDHNQEKYKSDTIFRFRPRINKEINGHFICDDGRLSYKEENEERLSGFFQKNREISEESALSYLLRYLHDEKPLLIISPALSTEEIAIIHSIAKRFKLELNAYSEVYYDEEFADHWLRSSNTAANLNAVKHFDIKDSKEDLITSLNKTNVVINFNHKGFKIPKFATVFSNKTQVHLISHIFDECHKHELLIPISSYSEHNGTLINKNGILQKFEAGLCNDRKSILELFNIILSTPKTVQEVWNDILNEKFNIKYENISEEGTKL